MATAPVLEREFDDAGAADDDTVVVVDLADLTFMDSSGINLLLRLTDRFPTRLRVINGSPAVERLLVITGLRDRLPMISDDTDPFAPLQ
jgi:anti-anti-sigma factor